MSLFKNVKKTTSTIAPSSIPKSNTNNTIMSVVSSNVDIPVTNNTDDGPVQYATRKPVIQQKPVVSVEKSTPVKETKDSKESEPDIVTRKVVRQTIRTIAPPDNIDSNPILSTMYKKLGGTIKIAGYDDNPCYGFDEMNLDKPLLDAIYRILGFERPSPIQVAAIGPAMKKRDVLCQGQAGTGKTAAYGIPTVQSILNENKSGVKRSGCRVLILSPTRELTEQTYDVVTKLCEFTNVTVAAHIGGRGPTRDDRGVNYTHNVKPDDTTLGIYSLPEYCEDIIIATPGRVCQLIEKRFINLSDINMIILDEADKMLQHNFMDAIIKIFTNVEQQATGSIQVALYSATYSAEIQQLAEKFMQNPVKILVSTENVVTDNQNQYILQLENDDQKEAALNDIFAIPGVGQVIVFCNRIYMVKHVTEQLKILGVSVGCIHSELTQEERDSTMNDFKNGRIKVMVGTDVISRGIDTDVNLVINYDIPRDVESYVHRIGRTGRFGKDGNVINIVNSGELDVIKRIVKFYRIKLMPMSKFTESQGLMSKVLNK